MAECGSKTKCCSQLQEKENCADHDATASAGVEEGLAIAVPSSLPSSSPSPSSAIVYGGYDFSFVEDVSDSFICNICTKVLKSPYLTECCGQNYCKSCLEHWSAWNRQGSGEDQHFSCPHCRTKDFKHIIDKRTERLVKELQVFCLYRVKGCDWRGELGDADTHDRKCKFSLAECTNGCGKQVSRRKIEEHLAGDCPLRSYQCQFCGEEGSHRHITEEHQPSCPEFPLECPNNCGQEMKRKELVGHIDACPREKVPCPFAGDGCREFSLRCDLASHVDACQEKHMPEAFRMLQKEVRSLNEALVSLLGENSQLKQELSENALVVSELTSRLNEHESIFKMSRRIIKRELAFLHPTQEPCQVLSLECLTSLLQDGPLQLEVDSPPITFRLSGYSELKENGHTWYGPSFHICNGYRVCMAVHTNGIGVGAQTHVSVSFYLKPSEHDDQLAWPVTFHNEFKVMLMKQTEGGKTSSLSRFALHHPDSPRLFPRKKNDKLSGIQQPAVVVAHSQSACCFSESFSQIEPINKVSLGPQIAKTELFCAKKMVDDLAYKDSLVFRCSIQVSDLTTSLNASQIISQVNTN